MADFMIRNREHFDKMAANYEGDWAEMLARTENEVRERRDWLGVDWVSESSGPDHVIKVLDYACGPGTISRALLGRATKFVGLDISDGMIAEYNNFASKAGIPKETMYAQQGDLLGDTPPEALSGPEFFDFNFVGVGCALHHFADPELAMKRFAERLKKGGVCLVIDMVPGQGDHLHEHISEVKHIVNENRMGFGKEEMREIFANAGLTKGFDYVVPKEPAVFTMGGKRAEVTLFLAKAELA